MKKTVLVIWDDIYHPEKTYTEITHRLFDGDDWNLILTYDARDQLRMQPKPDLVVNFTIGRPDGHEDLTLEEQEQILKQVESGVNALYVHAGFACIQANTPVFEVARGRFASHPEPHNPVYCCAIPGIEHPIMKGVEPFEEPDEHYFCNVDIERVQPFMVSRSIQGTEIAGWTHQIGKGRVCGITPGHNAPMLDKMYRLLDNAAHWCVGELE